MINVLWREEPQGYYAPVDTHHLASAHVAQTYEIKVSQPLMNKHENTRLPVFYTADANMSFDMLRGISHILQNPVARVPPFILVGIGYPSTCPNAGAVLRARDLTFEGFPDFKPRVPNIEGVLLPTGGPITHGGEAFLSFIADELIPFVNSSYRTTDERWYFGHSGAGGFGLFALFRRPNVFQRYFISSPGIAFNGELDGKVYHHYHFMLDRARAFIDAQARLDEMSLYLSAGRLEEFQASTSSWQTASATLRLAAMLREANLGRLRIECELFPNVDHMSAWPLSFIHGLKWAFAGTNEQRCNGVK